MLFRNELNVFKMGWFPWRYPGNWWRNIKNFFKCLKRAWERATKGYCHWDTYDLGDYMVTLILESIKKFRKDLIAYPVDMTYEEWEAILDEVIYHLEIALSEADNPYENDLHAAIHREALGGHTIKVTAENEDIRQKYFDFEKEQSENRIYHLREGLKLWTEHVENIWW